VRTRGLFLECDQAKQPYPLRIGADGGVRFRGGLIAPGGVLAVSFSCDGQPLGDAELTPGTPGLARLGRLGAKLYPATLVKSMCVKFSFRLDAWSLPEEARAVTITAQTRRGLTRQLFVDVRRMDTRPLIPPYEQWRQTTGPTAGDLLWMTENARHFDFLPAVTLFMHLRAPEEVPLLRATLRSLRWQAYPHWSLAVLCEPQAHGHLQSKTSELGEEGGRLRAVLVPAGAATVPAGNLLGHNGELAGPIDPGDVLEPHALFEAVYAFNRQPEADLVYSDEDTIGADNGRKCPFFKPDPSPDLLLGVNYIGRLWLARASLFEQAGCGLPLTRPAEHDVLLRLSERARHIEHVRTVLYARRDRGPNRPQPPADEGHRAVAEALRRRGTPAEVLPGPRAGTYRVKYALKDPGLVSILVLADRGVPASCLNSILAVSTYAALEVLVLTPGKPQSEGRPHPPGPRTCSVLTYPRDFSRAQAFNYGASRARGRYLLFMEEASVVTPDWVEALLEHAQRPEVAAVGGKVLDRQGSVYHAGLFLNNRDVGSCRTLFAADGEDAGPFGIAAVARTCTAVGSACLMVRRAVFDQLGGFDPGLPPQQADVDFCLRAAVRGYRVMATPHAVLAVAHSCRDYDPDEEPSSAAYWDRWRAAHDRGDPYYNPNLTLTGQDYSVGDEITVVHHSPRPLLDAARVRKILLVKLDHLGDMLVALPAIRQLRQAFPEAEITALVGSWCQPLLANDPAVDRVLCLDFFSADSSRPQVVWTTAERDRIAGWLQGMDFDLAIDLRWDPETRFLLRLCGAPYTAGYAGPNAFPWLTVAVPAQYPTPTQVVRLHMTQMLLQVVEAVERAAQPVEPLADLRMEEADAARLLGSLPGGGKFLVGIHPGAGTHVKRWAPERFARLADLCVERLGARVVLLGGSGDLQRVDEVLRHMHRPQGTISLAGQVSFAVLPGVMRRLNLYVGNDSGPSHLAASLGVPTLTIFAAATQHVAWSPAGSAVATVRRALPCSPCHLSFLEHCPNQHACMEHLSVEQVWEAALRLLLPQWSCLGAKRGLLAA
jgi:ADP-heptose:LPS heptosyltransferase